MSKLNDILNKSLEEVEALADEVLAKSDDTEEIKASTDEAEKSLSPADVSEGAGDEEEEDEDKKDKKDKEEEEEDEEDEEVEKSDKEDKEEEDEEDEEEEESTQKSFSDYVNENDEISKALEVSDFLSEFTRVHGSVIDSLRGDVEKSLQTSTQTSTVLAKSFNAIMKSQNELVKSINSLQERLDDVERQPVGRKAQVSVMEKSFNHSAGIEEVEEELSKSEKLAKLTDMAMANQNGVTINDVVSYESTGTLRPEIESALQNK